ncbi:MAG TPA: murein biosynthesis integral membrane protein MurJ [Myxococcota bacterium]
MDEAPEGRPRSGQLTAVAILLAASVLLSRVLGYLRDAVLAWRIGASVEADAYFAAFMLPDLLNHFLAGGALTIAFIPFYTKVRSGSGQEAAERFLSVILGTLGALTVLVTVLLWVCADALVALQFPRFTPEAQALTARLTRILLPAQIFFVMGGVIRGALMAHGRFATQALAPILYNLGIIVGGVALGGLMGAEGFAWGALAGAVVGPFLAPLLEAARAGEPRIRLRVAPFDRAFLRYLVLALPLILGVSLLTVDEWYDRWFGALFAPGTVAHLTYARRLMLLPVGIVGQAIATAALPLLSHLWSEGRREEMNRTLLETLRVGLGLALFATGAFFVFADPLVTLLYERGRFAAEDTVRVVALLRIFAFAIPAWIVQQIAVRSFYARGDTWRPMLLATGIAAPAAALYWLLGIRYGPRGLAAAGVIGMSASALATLLLAKRLHGSPPLRPLFSALLRTTGATVFAAFVAQVGALWLPLPSSGAVGALILLAGGGALYALAAFAALHVAGDPPLRAAVQRVLRSGRRTGA